MGFSFDPRTIYMHPPLSFVHVATRLFSCAVALATLVHPPLFSYRKVIWFFGTTVCTAARLVSSPLQFLSFNQTEWVLDVIDSTTVRGESAGDWIPSSFGWLCFLIIGNYRREVGFKWSCEWNKFFDAMNANVRGETMGPDLHILALFIAPSVLRVITYVDCVSILKKKPMRNKTAQKKLEIVIMYVPLYI